jgi:hypothetical protein
MQQRVLFYLALTVNTDHNEEMNNDHKTKENQTRMIVLFKVSSLPVKRGRISDHIWS